MRTTTLLAAAALTLAAGAGCARCVEPTEQEKKNQEAWPVTSFNPRIAKTSVGPMLGPDSGGAKALEVDAAQR